MTNTTETEILNRWATEDAAYNAVVDELGRPERAPYRHAVTGALVTDTAFLERLDAKLAA